MYFSMAIFWTKAHWRITVTKKSLPGQPLTPTKYLVELRPRLKLSEKFGVLYKKRSAQKSLVLFAFGRNLRDQKRVYS